ncbi:hypothetical protein K4A83_12900 [Spirulina subsalsa FACHB-351]|uniref:Uncharacterized protein n=1 Tax=Spirulina subsalsa FACHB-351 TaxID=234711 RepID=A0ABT3L6M3_9CYAN|nr:hypothetical protein [Spirulina subsalsa]MCW6037161.1 hypothetical protein [Spirulina subsalsa FACHB-351]
MNESPCRLGEAPAQPNNRGIRKCDRPIVGWVKRQRNPTPPTNGLPVGWVKQQRNPTTEESGNAIAPRRLGEAPAQPNTPTNVGLEVPA